MSEVGNNEHSTFNAQLPRGGAAAFPWMLNDECWVLDVFHSEGGKP